MSVVKRVFVYSSFLMIFFWACPWFNGKDAAPIFKKIKPYIRPVVGVTGLWQGWSMFSPNPLKTNLRVQVVVEYKNSSQMTHRFPSLHGNSAWENIFLYRHRKWNGNIRKNKNKRLWPYVTKALSKRHQKDGKIKNIHLEREWQRIPSPHKKFLPYRFQPKYKLYRFHSLYEKEKEP